MTADFQRWKLTLAYDGRPFSGWQSQPGGETVQDYLESALERIVGQGRIVVHGAGRTDAGVHAEGQVAHFDAPAGWRMDREQWQRALHANLPGTIRIYRCEPVGADFHARFSTVGKSYLYKIHTGDVLPPLQLGMAWHLHNNLQESDLAAVLARFVGTRDFRCFAANRGSNSPPVESTVRTIYEATLSRPLKDEWVLTFRGDGFLYKMVRLLVGTAIRVCQGKLELSVLEQLLAAQGDLKTSACAPPGGLYLARVYYKSPLAP